ncbi:MAG: hypothetical protein JWP12_3220 [Bacteroidetes bacterium]|nr:hypothetical protein [Bacteroidota bacterium]
MGKLIKLTLLADLVSCFIMFFSYLLFDPGHAFLALIYTFGNILIPTFIAVIIYRLLKQKTTLSNSFRTIAFQICMLIIIYLIGIFIWMAGEIMLFGHLTHHNITKEFNSEFKPWLPALFSLAFFIPFIDNKISKNESKPENKHNT